MVVVKYTILKVLCRILEFERVKGMKAANQYSQASHLGIRIPFA